MIYLDYFEIAREMLIYLEELDPSWVIMHEKEDVEEVANFLIKAFDPTLIADLGKTPEGIMILIGMTTATYSYMSEEPDDQKKEEKKIPTEPRH